jgi:homoserine kinase
MGNVGGLIGLYTRLRLNRAFLHDEIVEPLRSVLIPGFDLIKKTAMENGALGSGISGSGPSIFALSKEETLPTKLQKP